MQVFSFIVGPFETNVYVASCPVTGKAVVIDPGIDSEPVYDFIKRKGLTLESIVNTHGHIDHVYGNYFFKIRAGVPLLIHEADALQLKGIGSQAVAFGLREPEIVEPDHFLKEHDVVKVGEEELTVIHTPGHTPGGICLYRPDIIFVGDTLFAGSIGRTDLPGGSYPLLIESIRTKLLTLPDKTVVYCGHGPETTIGEERQFNPFLS